MNYYPVGRKLPCIYEGEPKLVKGFNIFYVTEDTHAFGSNITCVFLNNKVHVFNVSPDYHQAHKIYEGKECRMMNKSPYALSCAFVFRNKLYIAGRNGTKKSAIWEYNESNDTWTLIVTDIPCDDIGSGVAITRDEVHFFGGRQTNDTSSYILHYKFDGTTVTQLNYLPKNGYHCKALTDSVGTIHIFGLYEGAQGYTGHYIYTSDGVFTKTDSPLLYSVSDLGFVLVNGAIHAIGSDSNVNANKWENNHYIWTLDNQQWTKAEDIPFIDSYWANATSHDDIIEVVNDGGHYKKILGQWYNQSPSPYVIPIFN